MQHIPWHTAIETAYRAGESIARTTELPLSQALRCYLAEDVSTPIPLPHYDSSAMDGYAFAGSPPWRLLTPEPTDSHENVHRRALPLFAGLATPVLTGGLIPSGTEAVIRLEQTELVQQDEAVTVYPTGQVPAAGSDIRRTGEELTAGSTVACAGEQVSPRLLAFLAVCGLDTLPVWAPVSVAIAYTGNEVIVSGLPGPGEVRDAYSAQFPDLINGFGARLISEARLHDDMQQLGNWFTSVASAQVLILTGGSSTSEVDLLRKLLAKLKAGYLFEAVAVRPGHPCLAARLPDGRLVLCLPGNPLAAHTSLYSYLPALLAGAACRPLPARPTAIVQTSIAAFHKSDTRLVPARISAGCAMPFESRSKSHMLSSFAQANALLAVPQQGVEAGQSVPYLPLDPVANF